MVKKHVIRCAGPAHNRGRGNIILAVEGNKIFFKCSDRYCGLWNEVEFNVPGVTLQLERAGIICKPIPEGVHLDMRNAAVVIANG